MNHRQTVFRLWKVLRPLRVTLTLSVGMRIVNHVLAIILIVLAVWGISAIARGGGSRELWSVALALVGLGMVKGVFRYLEQFSGHYVAFRLLADLRRQLYDSLEALAPAGLGSERSGDLVSRAIADVERVEVFYAHTIAPAIVAMVIPFAVLGALAVVSPASALVLLPIVLLVGVVIPFAAHQLGMHAAQRTRNGLGEIAVRLADTIQGIRETLVFGYGDRGEALLERAGDEVGDAQKGLARCSAFQSMATELAIGAGVLAVMILGSREVLSGTMPVKEFPLVLALTLSVFVPLLGITNLIPDFEQAISSARRLFAIIDRPESDLSSRYFGGGRPKDSGIVFDRVAFSYEPDGAPALDRVSFTMKPGEITAIVGASGAGKSTLVNLLLRYWQERRGDIRLGGISLRTLAPERLRDLIAVVPQRVHVFNMTLRENIRLARPEATDEQIETAARLARIHDFIMEQPEGYDTQAHEGGSRLSGGQRQRIAIARAFLRDARVLVFDEATAHLDERTERDIMDSARSWQAMAPGRTVMVIAHRLACVQDASRIVVLERGQVAGFGRHDELLESCEVYADLFAAQSSGALV